MNYTIEIMIKEGVQTLVHKLYSRNIVYKIHNCMIITFNELLNRNVNSNIRKWYLCIGRPDVVVMK